MRRSFLLTLFHTPYSVSCAVVAFTLSILIQPLLPEGTGFVCKGLSYIWLFLFSHFHIFTLELQLSLISCSSTSLGLPWRIFLGTHSPLYAMVPLVWPPWKLSRKDRTDSAKKAIPLHNVQDFLKKPFCYTKSSGKGHAGVSLFFSHALYLPPLYTPHLIYLQLQHHHCCSQQFLCTGTVIECLKLLSFHII